MQISKSERDELHRNLRERKKVLKAGTKLRSAELRADFENQLGQRYSFHQDENWERAKASVEGPLRKAQREIEARCRELGIPKQFAPSLHLYWSDTGYGNSVDRQKAEQRRMAHTHIEALQQQADLEIDKAILEVSTRITATALTSEAAMAMFASLPNVEALMPALSFAEIAGESETPIAERLVSPNALRQRRFRERQALRQHNDDCVTPALCNGAEPQEEGEA